MNKKLLAFKPSGRERESRTQRGKRADVQAVNKPLPLKAMNYDETQQEFLSTLVKLGRGVTADQYKRMREVLDEREGAAEPPREERLLIRQILNALGETQDMGLLTRVWRILRP
jgi:hypothetical protein